MSVYIKDMEMPIDCLACRISCKHESYMVIGRPEDCPLEEAKTSDLISRADAIEAVRMSEHRITIADEQGGVGTVKWDMWGVYTAEAVEAIKALPSAEAVQGEWIDMEISCNPYPPVFCVECSMCGYRVGRETFLENTFNFCPSCGAKMKGADNEID